jgi:hypothetical protein
MSVYHLDIKGNINLSDYSNINDYIGLVDTNDEFTITLYSVPSENIELICSMLEDRNFIIYSKEGQDDDKYHISAYKRKQ